MKLLLTFLFTGFIFLGFGQLTTASITSVDKIVISATDSLGTPYQDTVIQIKVNVNDFDFFGEILATLTDQPTQYPLIMIKKTKAQIEAASLYNSSTGEITLLLPAPESTGILDVRVVVRNYQGGNLPFLDTTYSN